MRNRRIMLAGLLCLFGASLIQAQTVKKGQTVSETVTITAIDPAKRQVTVRNEKAEENTFVAPKELTRFDELKVGDTVKMTYYESMVFQLRKAGEATQGTSGQAGMTAAKGALPGGTLAAQERRTVTVQTLDKEAGSITVATEDGRIFTRKVADKKNLEGVSVGDKIDITYTLAVLANVARK